MKRHVYCCALTCGLLACVPPGASSTPRQTTTPGAMTASDGGVTATLDAGFTAPPVMDTDSGVVADSGSPSPKPDTGAADAGMPPAPPPDAGPAPVMGLPILGGGTHDISTLTLTVVADSMAGHDVPTDLAFHPQRTDQLWVVNQGDNSVWVASEAGKPAQRAQWELDRGSGPHFLARPSSLAFGENGNFTTAQDEDRVTQSSTPADFMGPTMWSSDMSIFDAGHGGHLDMLHNSPNGKGVAWERANVYWYFDGAHASITRYDFNRDHGPGGADHTDGVVSRYVEGEVRMDPEVPSHMDLDHATGQLYVADTGNNRIAVLDTQSGTRGRAVRPNYDGTDQHRMEDGEITTFVDGSTGGFVKPVGLELHEGLIFISDNTQSRFYAFDMNGVMVDYLDTGLPPGSLMGLTFGEDGALWFVDAIDNRVLRITTR